MPGSRSSSCPRPGGWCRWSLKSSPCCGNPCLYWRALLRDLAEGVGLGLLGSVGVLGACVDLELGELGPTNGVLREHATDGLLDGTRRVLLEHFGVGGGPQSARVTRVAVGLLLRQLGAGEGYLLGVDDDDEVAHVHVGGEGRLVLAAEQGCRVAGQTAEDYVSCVDDDPVALDILGLGGKGARHSNAAF